MKLEDPFNRRFRQLISKVNNKNIASNVFENLRDCKLPTPSGDGNALSLCWSKEQRCALKTLVQNFDTSKNEDIWKQTPPSATLIQGAVGNGKKFLIALGIVTAIKNGMTGICVYGPTTQIIEACRDNVAYFIKLLGLESTGKQNFTNHMNLKIGSQVVHFALFDQTFVKPNASLLCLLESGSITKPQMGETSTNCLQRLLRHNPQQIWCSVASAGHGSAGSSQIGRIEAALRHFCDLSSTDNDEEVSQHVPSGKVPLQLTTTRNTKNNKEFQSMILTIPILYAAKDPLEKCVNSIYCLNSPSIGRVDKEAKGALAYPGHCDVFLANKTTLFSGHHAAELLLSQFMELYSSFDYERNQQSLRQLMNEPNHHLFIMQQPVKSDKVVPIIYSIAHVSINHDAGELLQLEEKIPSVRVEHLVTRAECHRLGYGRQLIERLHSFFSQPPNQSSSAGDNHPLVTAPVAASTEISNSVEAESLPPLYINLDSELAPMPETTSLLLVIQPLTVSLKFWTKKCRMVPVNIRPGDVSCVLARRCSPGSDVDERAFAAMCSRLPVLFRSSRALKRVDTDVMVDILSHKTTAGGFPNVPENADVLKADTVRYLTLWRRDPSNCMQSVVNHVQEMACFYYQYRTPDLLLSRQQQQVMVGLGLQVRHCDKLALSMAGIERRPGVPCRPAQLTEALKHLFLQTAELARLFTHYIDERKAVAEEPPTEEQPAEEPPAQEQPAEEPPAKRARL